MRRVLLGLVAATTLTGSLFIGGATAQAAPPPKQCFGVLPCDGPIQKAEDAVRRIAETCQYAYCVFP